MASLAPKEARLAGQVGSEAGALFVVALVALLLRAVWLGDPAASPDEQLYSLVGQQLLQGHLPYVDIWDRKPLGLFGLYALAHWLGGAQPLAYQLLALAFAVAGGALVYALARPIGGRMAAGTAGVLYQILMIAYGSHAGQSEVFHVPMMLGALLLLRDWAPARGGWPALAAMLLCGVALQVKYTVLPQCLFLGLFALWRLLESGAALPRLATWAVAFAALGVLPTALAGLAYAALGHWPEFAFSQFASFFQRAPAAGGRFPLGHLPAVMPLATLLAGGAWASLRLARPQPLRHYALIAGWTLSALGTVLLPATVYLYYYAPLVPGVVLLALPLYDCRRMLGWAMALTLVVINYALLDMPSRFRQAQERRTAIDALAQAIRPAVGPDGPCLYIHDGPTALYRLSGSCLPSRYAYPDHLNNALETPALGIGQADEVARILRARPGAIVTADRPVTPQAPQVESELQQALAREYRPVARRAIDRRMVVVWQRADGAAR